MVVPIGLVLDRLIENVLNILTCERCKSDQMSHVVWHRRNPATSPWSRRPWLGPVVGDALQNCHDPIARRGALPEDELVDFLIDGIHARIPSLGPRSKE